MDDILYDDVKALIDGDFGDDRILKQIFRACKNNEVVSKYEKNYVRELTEKYFGKKRELELTPSLEDKTALVPDVVLPDYTAMQYAQTLKVKSSKFSRLKSKKRKIIFGVIIILLAGMVISAVPSTIKNSQTDTALEGLVIETDLTSYNNKDIISIYGTSDVSDTVNLSINNSGGQTIWSEQVYIKNNGKYSTLVIAGGSGWEDSGTYSLNANDGKNTESIVFNFIS